MAKIVGQTSVKNNLTEVFPGVLVRSRLVDKISAYAGVVATGEDEIKFGSIVYFSDYSGEIPTCKVSGSTAASRKVDGFVIHQALSSGKIVDGTSVAVLRKGVIWVDNTEGTIVAGSSVIYDNSSKKLSTGAAASGDSTLHGCKFLTGGAAGVLVQLEVNFPSYNELKA